MKTGFPIVLSLNPEEKEDRIKAEERIITVTNENVDKVFRALRNNVDFEENLDGYYKKNYEVLHNEEQQVAHKLGRNVNNCIVSGGNHLARARVYDSNTNTAAIKAELPHTFFTAAVVASTTGYVADAYQFAINDIVAVASDSDTTVVISEIDYPSRKLTFSANIDAAQYESVFIKTTKINIFVF